MPGETVKREAFLRTCAILRVHLRRTLTTAHRERRREKGKASCEATARVVAERKEATGLRRSERRSRKEERRVDAKAPYAEEGRGKLRKAPGSRKQAKIRGYPNGGTRREERPVTV